MDTFGAPFITNSLKCRRFDGQCHMAVSSENNNINIHPICIYFFFFNINRLLFWQQATLLNGYINYYGILIYYILHMYRISQHISPFNNNLFQFEIWHLKIVVSLYMYNQTLSQKNKYIYIIYQNEKYLLFGKACAHTQFALRCTVVCCRPHKCLWFPSFSAAMSFLHVRRTAAVRRHLSTKKLAYNILFFMAIRRHCRKPTAIQCAPAIFGFSSWLAMYATCCWPSVSSNGRFVL